MLVAALTYLGTSRRDPAIRRRADLVETFNSEFHRSEDIYGLFADIELDRSVFPEGRTSWLSADPERTVVHLLDLFNSLGLELVSRSHLDQGHQSASTMAAPCCEPSSRPRAARYLEFVHRHDQEHLGTGVPFEFFQILTGRLHVATVREPESGRSALLGVPHNEPPPRKAAAVSIADSSHP